MSWLLLLEGCLSLAAEAPQARVAPTFPLTSREARQYWPTGIGERHEPGGHVRLVDSTITGNGLDIVTFRTPRLLRSTCDASARLVQNAAQPSNYDITGTWGVCAND